MKRDRLQTVAERWEQVTGSPLVQGYGLTEASPLVTCNLFTEKYNGTIGYPVASTEIQIVDQQGRITTVSLSDPHYGESLDPKLFTFVDPNPHKNPGDNGK